MTSKLLTFNTIICTIQKKCKEKVDSTSLKPVVIVLNNLTTEFWAKYFMFLRNSRKEVRGLYTLDLDPMFSFPFCFMGRVKFILLNT